MNRGVPRNIHPKAMMSSCKRPMRQSMMHLLIMASSKLMPCNLSSSGFELRCLFAIKSVHPNSCVEPLLVQLSINLLTSVD